VSSPSFLKAVMDGKRNLTSRMIERFCAALEFSFKEGRYFTHLVHFNQAKTAREKQEHYAVLRSMAGTVNESILRSDQYDYYDKWYVSVLRELVCLHDFRDDYALLGRTVTPPITASEARKGVELLVKLGLVARKEDGAYRQTRSAISADGAVTSLAVRSFIETMLEQAKQSIHGMDRGERHVSSLTIGISAAGYDALVAEIRAFKDRVKALAHRDEGTSRVYHLSLGLIPGSRDVGDLRDADEARAVEAGKEGTA
jgi:uncharacterized protein (TIGR02147 family)